MNRFTLNLYLDILPDSIVSTLSNQSKLVNNLVYYDQESINNIGQLLNTKIVKNLNMYLRIMQLGGINKIETIDIFNDPDVYNFLISISNNINNLIFLVLQDNEIDNESAKIIANIIEKSKSIEYLYLVNNNIQNISYIAKALEDNKTIRKFLLNSNQIGNDGAKDLAKTLKINNTIDTLSISDNQIGDIGTKALADMLKINKGLYELNLATNNITNNGAIAIASSLSSNSTLNKLLLYDNNITYDGAKEYIPLINKIPFLHLDIIPNNNFNYIQRKTLESFGIN